MIHFCLSLIPLVLSYPLHKLYRNSCIILVTCNPVPKSDTPSTSVQKVQMSLKRTARMTPLWRIMGTKPHGAYCQNNYECSTGICRKGHCSYSQPINS
uniref:Liver-expressed antimicrobial peptide 2-like n=1 Tax=Sinocyclocheilus grahami TaxID=75366 RepID=A0A672T571_SINGR